ncbi:MAG: peptidoglycan-associated lipoprotein Pal [Candidatus Palauibacterales bacterium]|nr:peptidoglycan-associated lipoprotein Pal [Candidatus Palauibacterales bacterium]
MRRAGVWGGLILLGALGAAACGGNPPPEPEPEPQTTTAPDTADENQARRDSIRREREASELCSRAEAALEAGNYQRARRLFQRAQSEYGGTACARRAESGIAKVAAVETIKERVHFEFDRSRITDEAAETLQAKAEVLREYPKVRITVEGHADERGSLEYNQALGMRRAQATLSYLVDLGLAKNRFSTVSYGEERPLVDASNERAWAQNRRAEFVIENMSAINP